MARLGEAVALSQVPPTTQDSLANVRRILQEVVSSDDSAAAHAAKFHLGRLAQFDPFGPDPVTAATHYEELIATGIDDEWTRLARVKLSLLYLVGLPDGGELAVRLERVEGLIANTTAPAARRDLHLIVAEVRLYNGLQDATTLAHLAAAATTGGLDEMMQADLLIQRARLSERLERRDEARTLYREFLKTYPKDNRHYTVAATLRELERTP